MRQSALSVKGRQLGSDSIKTGKAFCLIGHDEEKLQAQTLLKSLILVLRGQARGQRKWHHSRAPAGHIKHTHTRKGCDFTWILSAGVPSAEAGTLCPLLRKLKRGWRGLKKKDSLVSFSFLIKSFQCLTKNLLSFYI